jgi:hypothetical protein
VGVTFIRLLANTGNFPILVPHIKQQRCRSESRLGTPILGTGIKPKPMVSPLGRDISHKLSDASLSQFIFD